MFIFKNRSETVTDFVPNLLVTNFCNQQCSYCFAQENMAIRKQKEITLKNFSLLTKLYQKNHLEQIKLLGGEPTLHSQFIDILEIANKSFKEIWIFTNCLIPPNVNDYLNQTKNKNIVIVANLDTVAYKEISEKHEEIINLLSRYSQFARIYSGFTISDLAIDYTELYKDMPKYLLDKMSIRFGIAKPIMGHRTFFNPMSQNENREVGRKVFKTVIQFDKIGIQDITLDCGLTPNMFTDAEKNYLKNRCHLKGWGCHGYWGEFDIDTDLTVLPCFPHSSSPRKKITDFSSFKKVSEELSCKTNCIYQTFPTP